MIKITEIGATAKIGSSLPHCWFLDHNK